MEPGIGRDAERAGANVHLAVVSAAVVADIATSPRASPERARVDGDNHEDRLAALRLTAAGVVAAAYILAVENGRSVR